MLILNGGNDTERNDIQHNDAEHNNIQHNYTKRKILIFETHNSVM